MCSSDLFSTSLSTVATMLKDVENVAALAHATGTELAGLNGVLASYRTAAAQGLGSADLSDIVRVAWPERPGPAALQDPS